MTDRAEDPRFASTERPAMPGGPYMPTHPMARRVRYFLTAITIAILGTFPNALVSVNSSEIAGDLGLYTSEGIWLTIAYTAFGAGSSLLVIKGRVQFGVETIFRTLITFYIGCALIQLLVPGFATAVLVRAANGLVTSTGVALGVYYLLEALPAKRRIAAVAINLGMLQLGTPLARLVPVDLLTAHVNLGARLFDFGVPLLELALVLASPLPPTPTYRVMEKLDILTVAFLFPALLLLVAGLANGRTYWWWDTPWVGWLLIFAVPLFALAAILEFNRSSPAFQMRWIGSKEILRFAAIAFIERFAAAEQSYGAVSLLSMSGLNNDQFHGLFAVVALAMVAGVATAALTIGKKTIPLLTGGALMLIAVAAWIDSFSNGNTRMDQMMGTQAMIGFATTLFVGPALVSGLGRMLAAGPTKMLSLIMVFSFTQNIGSLTASAVLSSYQYVRSEAHDRVLDDSLRLSRPLVAGRISDGAAAATAITPSVGLATELSAGDLIESTSDQGEILGYIDVFRLIALLAFASAVFIACAVLWSRFKPAKEGSGKA